MSDEPTSADRLLEAVTDLQRVVAQLSRVEMPSVLPVQFTPERLHFRDEFGPSAASYGVYNPVAARVYLGLFGAQAGPHSFPVPAESALVMPLDVPGPLELAIDEAELGKSEATIYVMRFRLPQPFFLGRL